MSESASEKLMIHTELQALSRKIDHYLRTKSENVQSPENLDKPSLSLNMTTKAYTTENSKDSLPDRVFIKRNSLLTEMFKQNHIRTIRHIFISIMIILALQVIVSDLVENGSIDLNFELIRWAFDKFQVVCYTWFYMIMSSSCLVYYSFHFWSNDRIKQFSSDANTLFKYDLLWLTLYCIYLVLFILLPCYVVATNKLPVASAFIILIEQ
ncbi:sterol O-acyltransferase 1-like isoform X2, partial [Brachionus plicatilis]